MTVTTTILVAILIQEGVVVDLAPGCHLVSDHDEVPGVDDSFFVITRARFGILVYNVRTLTLAEVSITDL
jgi:hypothetical protein